MQIGMSFPPNPRDTLSCLRPHRGVMVFRPETNDYVKYAVALGEPNRAGFIPMNKALGFVGLGVIFLKKEGAVETGFYAVLPRDIYRRRIDARPSRKLTIEQATLLLGGSLDHLAAAQSSEDQRGAGADASDEELHAADLAFKEQVRALQGTEDSKGAL